MEAEGARKRQAKSRVASTPDQSPSEPSKAENSHPAGEVKHGGPVQLLRMLLFTMWFCFGCMCIHATQLLGLPLYLIDRDYYYAYMALTKQSFGLILTTITQWFSPTLIRISGDASLQNQLRLNPEGLFKVDFPERLVLIANHQVYTDWLYIWWVAYTGRMHGHIYIVLKEVLRYVPVLGPGMTFYGFIFMARKWASDKARLQHRLEKLKTRHSGPLSGSQHLDPMWLLIYPEGTNLSANTRKRSVAWAKKQGIPDLRHQLLPRSTGLFFCLQQLQGTVDWVYDCTVGYEGTPKNGYAQDYFTLRSTFFQGRPPKSVNMYWRRFHMSSIPLSFQDEFDAWLNTRWLEKDELLEGFSETGRFPASEDATGQDTLGYIETEVRLEKGWEIAKIFVVLGAAGLVGNVLHKAWGLATSFRGG